MFRNFAAYRKNLLLRLDSTNQKPYTEPIFWKTNSNSFDIYRTLSILEKNKDLSERERSVDSLCFNGSE